VIRDGSTRRGALSHLSFGGPTQVGPFWLLVLKVWKYDSITCSALSKIYLLPWRLWFYDCLRSSTEIKTFLTFFSRPNGNAIFSWNL